jgi:hypothetical protein
MSCPYFYPMQPRGGAADSRAAMLPLGNLWAGVCRAVPGESCEPAEDILRRLCHLGYARGQCQRFPSRPDSADAVRFTIRGDDGRTLQLYYVLEQDHHPLAHGQLEYSVRGAVFACGPEDPLVCRQAEAYIASYLKRKKVLSVLDRA